MILCLFLFIVNFFFLLLHFSTAHIYKIFLGIGKKDNGPLQIYYNVLKTKQTSKQKNHCSLHVAFVALL